MWTPDGSAAQFCDRCQVDWWGGISKDEDDIE
jgi:hypothetical protein